MGIQFPFPPYTTTNGYKMCFFYSETHGVNLVEKGGHHPTALLMKSVFKPKLLLNVLLLSLADWSYPFQAVVRYMAESVSKRDVKTQPVKAKKTWTQFCFFSRPNNRKHDGMDYIMT